MAVLESESGVAAAVDPSHAALRASLRPLEHTLDGQVLGHYRMRARSGIMTGTGIVADAPVFSLRWTDPNSLLVLLFLEAFYLPVTTFTAAQELGLYGAKAHGFTAADGDGTLVIPRPVRRSMQPSKAAEVTIAAATLLTAGTRTIDANDHFDGGGAIVNHENIAAGTEFRLGSGNPRDFGFRYEPAVHRGEHPIVLGANEGIIVANTVVFPAAGTARLHVTAAWAEVRAY